MHVLKRSGGASELVCVWGVRVCALENPHPQYRSVLSKTLRVFFEINKNSWFTRVWAPFNSPKFVRITDIEFVPIDEFKLEPQSSAVWRVALREVPRSKPAKVHHRKVSRCSRRCSDKNVRRNSSCWLSSLNCSSQFGELQNHLEMIKMVPRCSLFKFLPLNFGFSRLFCSFRLNLTGPCCWITSKDAFERGLGMA